MASAELRVPGSGVSSQAEAACSMLARDGVCWIADVVPPGALDGARRTTSDHFGELLRTVLVNAAVAARTDSAPDAVRYAELVERDGGRFDCRDPRLLQSASLARALDLLRAVARRALGEDAQLIGCGQVVAMSAEGWATLGVESTCTELDNDGRSLGAQLWHMDGGHLYEGDGALSLPAHALTMFIPLVDVDEENGPTEFLVGSHRRRIVHPDDQCGGAGGDGGDGVGGGGVDGSGGGRRVPILAPAGSAIIFDYRTWHRGLPNRSARDRPVIYLVAARPWFADRNAAHERSIFGGDAPRGSSLRVPLLPEGGLGPLEGEGGSAADRGDDRGEGAVGRTDRAQASGGRRAADAAAKRRKTAGSDARET